MTSGGSDVDAALVALAWERLQSETPPAAVCGELAARTPCWWDAVLAVGRAMGIPESELLRRLHGTPQQVRSEFRPGEEELYGDLMAVLGVFDIPRQLDERESVIAESLRTAMRAMGGVASGHGLGLSRRLVTGELESVFRSLARSGPRADRGRPAEFWGALVAAGELLDPADGDERGTVAQALAECRLHLANCAR
ncbi:hypothetical protein SAM23877_7265 [Streptomyces ambofaciens ATCC 23877]|uniref:Uncharacterized protein n=1 Tax=Streptomyces ambofaciens (strain ATCC 23877 / 3486 / DSM 40053 / JCM 4204 / NBRC 12836 / NRRL B-2516) TaxID=278992 RepID=A0AC45_STRA7|nr:hypothetical protein [Streptomyces ambofaciens]AKZ60308.1 hypothetical protein SAM23877_7265 [Streptomyces ambofaciens ATCC 23877]CAJ88049.1 hypothetical protein SAMR0339 [Streptomyces ambofaciens ATCC 23877]